MCQFMNNCSGNGTCDNKTGKCTCNAGYKGADCLMKVETLKNNYVKTFTLNGT